MTRQEFMDNVTCWYDLIDFCNEQGCDVCEDVVDEDLRDEYLNDYVHSLSDYTSWWEVYETLENVPGGYTYYRYVSSTEFEGLDDYEDFDCYKADTLRWAESNGVFDEEDEEEEDEDEEDEEFDEDDELDEDAIAEEIALFLTSAPSLYETAKRSVTAREEIDVSDLPF